MYFLTCKRESLESHKQDVQIPNKFWGEENRRKHYKEEEGRG